MLRACVSRGDQLGCASCAVDRVGEGRSSGDRFDVSDDKRVVFVTGRYDGPLGWALVKATSLERVSRGPR
jgi:hypothetical protein